MKPRNYLFELSVWIFAIAGLACADPGDHHFTLCPLANLGLSWCPGCGLGRAMSCILHGQFERSFSYHWFGIPAVLVLLYRIIELLRKSLLYFVEKPI